MIISQPRIKREIREIERKIMREMRRRIEEEKKAYKADAEAKIHSTGLVKNGRIDLPTKVFLHVPEEEKLIEIENWLEENCQGSVLVGPARNVRYKFDEEDEGDDACEEEYDDCDCDVCDDSCGQKDDLFAPVDEEERPKKEDLPVMKYPSYEFHFENADDAVKFKLVWGGSY